MYDIETNSTGNMYILFKVLKRRSCKDVKRLSCFRRKQFST